MRCRWRSFSRRAQHMRRPPGISASAGPGSGEVYGEVGAGGYCNLGIDRISLHGASFA